MVQKTLSGLVLILCLVPASLLAQNKPRLAILDLQPSKGVSPVVAEVSTSYLKEVMVSSNRFTVIERAAINTILLEQAFQQSGCTDTSCAVKIGRLLAANTLLFGSIIKLEDRLVISAQIVNVEKGQVDFAATENARNVGDLERASKALGVKILRRMLGKDRVFQGDEVTSAGPRHLIPGWAYAYHDRSWEGFFLFSGWALLGANFLSANSAYSEAQSEYNDLTLPALYYTSTSTLALNYLHFQEKREAIKSASTRANLAVGLWVLYWGIGSAMGYFMEQDLLQAQAGADEGWQFGMGSPVTIAQQGESFRPGASNRLRSAVPEEGFQFQFKTRF